jgi:translation elongation factor EF-1alpha
MCRGWRVQKRPRFCVLGHVDCGKSTLVGTYAPASM